MTIGQDMFKELVEAKKERDNYKRIAHLRKESSERIVEENALLKRKIAEEYDEPYTDKDLKKDLGVEITELKEKNSRLESWNDDLTSHIESALECLDRTRNCLRNYSDYD